MTAIELTGPSDSVAEMAAKCQAAIDKIADKTTMVIMDPPTRSEFAQLTAMGLIDVDGIALVSPNELGAALWKIRYPDDPFGKE